MISGHRDQRFYVQGDIEARIYCTFSVSERYIKRVCSRGQKSRRSTRIREYDLDRDLKGSPTISNCKGLVAHIPLFIEELTCECNDFSIQVTRGKICRFFVEHKSMS
jgi:hypothetical protein